MVQRLALQVRSLHEDKRTHRAICAEQVSVDDSFHPHLSSAFELWPFGGEGADPQFCPPELADGEAFQLPEKIESAAAVLKKHGHTMDPRRIDVYQLGVLLCRLLTGESLLKYMYDPAAKALVPAGTETLLERTLGHQGVDRFNTCDELLAALEETISNIDSSTEPVAESNTPPHGSMIGATDTPARGNEAVSNVDDLPFDRLGHFQILSRIGAGGMGDVYRGYDESLDRHVAIKVLPTGLARDADFVERFKAEATAAAKVTHPNVVPVHFIGEDAGHHFFAMQFIEGETLSDRLKRRGRLPLDEALGIISQ
ncbi:MAG TPA: serine/threonine-protein kinase, partial [Thermoguttaceae bacterium]|nr:serine/threonine-protein kinase [Thermoguttaceae bacterium]